jgi:hypothetical protein
MAQLRLSLKMAGRQHGPRSPYFASVYELELVSFVQRNTDENTRSPERNIGRAVYGHA